MSYLAKIVFSFSDAVSTISFLINISVRRHVVVEKMLLGFIWFKLLVCLKQRKQLRKLIKFLELDQEVQSAKKNHMKPPYERNVIKLINYCDNLNVTFRSVTIHKKTYAHWWTWGQRLATLFCYKRTHTASLLAAYVVV